MGRSTFYDWRARYGKVNEHNGWIPRDFWLLPWEKEAIIQFFHYHPLDGWRRMAFMMLNADLVAASPTSVWRVLHDAKRLVGGYVEHYDNMRLHSAIAYVTPKDKLEGRDAEIFAERYRKLEAARELRKARRAGLDTTRQVGIA